MAKEYFPHDYSARSSLREVRKDFGLEGIGFYWCFVEMLHEEGGYIKESELEGVAFDLRVDIKLVESVVNNYGLFTVKKGKITSHRVLRNLKKRAEISEVRKAAAETRWNSSETEETAPTQTTEPLQEVELREEDQAVDKETAKQFYIGAIERSFQKWLDNASLSDLESHNVYDYKALFDNIIDEVKTKDFVIINRKNVPVYRFLQILGKHIKQNGEIRNLDQAIKDVESRYIQGKVKNKTNYLIAALYNAALVDSL